MESTASKSQPRKGKHLVAAWIDKPTVVRLKVLAAHQGTNLTALAAEAFEDVLAKYNKEEATNAQN